MFKITNSKGFHMTFANGYTLSVQWGPGNYCERRNYARYDTPRSTDWDSKDAEVAVFGEAPDGKWIRVNGDDVCGYLNPDQVLALAARVAAIDPKNPPESLEIG